MQEQNSGKQLETLFQNYSSHQFSSLSDIVDSFGKEGSNVKIMIIQGSDQKINVSQVNDGTLNYLYNKPNQIHQM